MADGNVVPLRSFASVCKELERISSLERTLSGLAAEMGQVTAPLERRLSAARQGYTQEAQPLIEELEKRSSRVAAFARAHPELLPRVRNRKTAQFPAGHTFLASEKEVAEIPDEEAFFKEVRARGWHDLIATTERPNKQKLDKERGKQLASVRYVPNTRYTIGLPGTKRMLVGTYVDGKLHWELTERGTRR